MTEVNNRCHIRHRLLITENKMLCLAPLFDAMSICRRLTQFRRQEADKPNPQSLTQFRQMKLHITPRYEILVEAE